MAKQQDEHDQYRFLFHPSDEALLLFHDTRWRKEHPEQANLIKTHLEDRESKKRYVGCQSCKRRLKGLLNQQVKPQEPSPYSPDFFQEGRFEKNIGIKIAGQPVLMIYSALEQEWRIICYLSPDQVIVIRHTRWERGLEQLYEAVESCAKIHISPELSASHNQQEIEVSPWYMLTAQNRIEFADKFRRETEKYIQYASGQFEKIMVDLDAQLYNHRRK